MVRRIFANVSIEPAPSAFVEEELFYPEDRQRHIPEDNICNHCSRNPKFLAIFSLNFLIKM
jgi:hypothetical protein